MGSRINPSARALVFLRVAIGVLFLIFAEYKLLDRRFILGGGMAGWVRGFLKDGAYPFMQPVLQRVVLPHAIVFAAVVSVAELSLGLCLVTGIWVRWASVGGFVYMMSLLFSANYPSAGAAFWQYFGASLDHSVLAVCFVALVIGGAETGGVLRLGRGRR